MTSNTHSTEYLAAEGETWVTLAHYEELLHERDRLIEQLEAAEAMCRDIVKRNPPSAFIDTWATVNKAQEFLASFPAKEQL